MSGFRLTAVDGPPDPQIVDPHIVTPRGEHARPGNSPGAVTAEFELVPHRHTPARRVAVDRIRVFVGDRRQREHARHGRSERSQHRPSEAPKLSSPRASDGLLAGPAQAVLLDDGARLPVDFTVQVIVPVHAESPHERLAAPGWPRLDVGRRRHGIARDTALDGCLPGFLERAAGIRRTRRVRAQAWQRGRTTGGRA